MAFTMTLIAKPFGMLLMFLYDLVGNYGIAIIIFALLIKIILLPFQMKSKRGMMQTTRLQPLMAELQKKHGANKAKYNEEVAKLYREENVNPASGCLWSFITLPIMIALFYAIRQPITLMMGVPATLLQEGGALLERLNELNFTSTVGSYYVEIAQSQFISANLDKFAGISDHLRAIDYSFIGVDLAAQPQWDFLWKTDWSNTEIWAPSFVLFLIPLLSGGAQFLVTWINQKMNPAGTGDNQMGNMKMMTMMMPLFSVYIAFITPAALGFYWTLSALLQLVQEVWLTKKYRKIIDAEEAERSERRRAKEAEIEAKRQESERKKAEGIVEKNPNKSKRKAKTLERQEQQERATEWQRRKEGRAEENEPSREGNRKYARGRNYDPDRYATATDESTEAGKESDTCAPEEETGASKDVEMTGDTCASEDGVNEVVEE